ncbi:MAG: VWA domain-containing protein [Acidobacteria bacterium]|nr:MAG: VWA domain-containing protein [Acidobacteriota bacterium]REK09144.1 MAG: VWA domain-containing protein [Acidobacteriota bacterium]
MSLPIVGLDVQLGQPWALVAMVLIPAHLWFARRRTRRASLPHGPLQLAPPTTDAGSGRGPAPVLEVLLIGLSVLCLARPQLVDDFETVQEEGIDLALVLDISASMQADDLRPNRLEALKALAGDLVRRSSGNRIGVYVFAKHVFTQTPLTTDTDLLDELIGELRYETIQHGESGGTALGDALLIALDALERQRLEGRSQTIVAFTDGESNDGIDPLLAARALRDQGVALQVVGVGRTEPVPVSVYGRAFINSEDEHLHTQLQEEQLQEVAAAAGGTYRHAESLGLLEAVFAELAELTTAPLDVRRHVARRSLVPHVAMAMLFLFAGWTVAESARRSPLR